MGRRRFVTGSKAALLLGAAVLLLSGCSVSGAERDLRFGWPTGVTKQATKMRVLWTWSGVAALLLGVIVWGLIFWCCIRYRKRGDDDVIPTQTKYNLGVEFTCVTIPLLVIVVLFYFTVVTEDNVNHLSKNPDNLVQVTAFKWNWQFSYLKYKAADGTMQTARYTNGQDLIRGVSQSPAYLSTVGSDNEIPVLVVPKGETVQVIEHSQDVIHSFWVPEFLFKRDVIPYGTAQQQKQSGLRDNRFEFTATTQGSFVGRCAELCGTYHSQMNFEVRVVSPGTFRAYLAALKRIGPNDPARQSKALVAAHVPGGAYATTTHPFPTQRTAGSAVGG